MKDKKKKKAEPGSATGTAPGTGPVPATAAGATEPVSEAEDAVKPPDPALVALEKKIFDAFIIFDNEGNKTVDIREIPTIVRSLGCCPTEAEVATIVAELQNATGYVLFDDFLPVMIDILLQQKYKTSSEDRLMKAFTLLDAENKSLLTADELQKILTEEGEPFTTEEMEEVLSVAVNTEDGSISYKNYIPHLLPSTDQDD